MRISQRQLQVDWSAADRHRSSVGCKQRWVDIVGSGGTWPLSNGKWESTGVWGFQEWSDSKGVEED